MSSYSILAKLYDVLTENVDYQVRSDYISDLFKASNVNVSSMIDLACGTCSISIPFAMNGVSVIGVDSSEEMLIEANSKLCDSGINFPLICSTMQEFVAMDKVDAVVCSLDSINHITDFNEVKKTFKNVYDSLNDNGVFVFDVNTVYKHQFVLADNTFVFEDEDYYLVWDNEQVDDREIRILLDFFLFNGKSYDRYSEEFDERAYSVDELCDALKLAGFNDISVFDELTLDEPSEDSERIYFVCKKVK